MISNCIKIGIFFQKVHGILALKVVRFVKEQKFVTADGRSSKFWLYALKDLDNSRTRITLWENNNLDCLEVGIVYNFSNLFTTDYPKNGPPFYFNTSGRTKIKRLPSDAQEIFKEITDVDGR